MSPPTQYMASASTEMNRFTLLRTVLFGKLGMMFGQGKLMEKLRFVEIDKLLS